MTFDMNVTYGHSVSFICYIQLTYKVYIHLCLRFYLPLLEVFITTQVEFLLLGMNISFCAYYLRVTSDNVYCEFCRSFFEKCFRFQLVRLFKVFSCSVSNSLIKCNLKLNFVHFISLWFAIVNAMYISLMYY